MAEASRTGYSGLIQPCRSKARAAGIAMQPVVIRGQIEFAHAAGNAGALLDRHQPFVLAQILTDLAGHVEQRRTRLLDFGNDLIQHVLGDFRIVAERQQHLFLPLQFLQQVRFQVGAARDLEDFEQREQRGVVIDRILAGEKEARAIEQVLQAQQRADAFVEGILVSDHYRDNPPGRSFVLRILTDSSAIYNFMPLLRRVAGNADAALRLRGADAPSPGCCRSRRPRRRGAPRAMPGLP